MMHAGAAVNSSKEVCFGTSQIRHFKSESGDERNLLSDVCLVWTIGSLLVSAWEQLPTERSCQLRLWLSTTPCSSGTPCAVSLKSVALLWSQRRTGRRR